MKRRKRIKFTLRNIVLMILVCLGFVGFFVFGAMLDSEPLWIPYTGMVISFTIWAWFYFANQDLIED